MVSHDCLVPSDSIRIHPSERLFHPLQIPTLRTCTTTSTLHDAALFREGQAIWPAPLPPSRPGPGSLPGAGAVPTPHSPTTRPGHGPTHTAFRKRPGALGLAPLSDWFVRVLPVEFFHGEPACASCAPGDGWAYPSTARGRLRSSTQFPRSGPQPEPGSTGLGRTHPDGEGLGGADHTGGPPVPEAAVPLVVEVDSRGDG